MTLVSLLSVVLSVAAGPSDAAACEKEKEAAFGSCLAACESLPVKDQAACHSSCEAKDADLMCDDAIGVASESLVDAKSLQAEAAAACHPVTTCPDPKSCASWSTWYDCGDPICRPVRGCGEDCDIDPRFCFGPGQRQPRERFRVCFLSGGTQCIEYQRTNVVIGCGCP
jgi:hypothetical protein